MAAMLSGLGVDALQASAAQPPSPANGQPAPDFGILSERRHLIGGGSPTLGHARQTPLAVACGASWREGGSQDRPSENLLFWGGARQGHAHSGGREGGGAHPPRAGNV